MAGDSYTLLSQAIFIEDKNRFVVTVAVGQCSGLFYVVVVEVIVNVIVVLCCFLCQKP